MLLFKTKNLTLFLGQVHLKVEVERQWFSVPVFWTFATVTGTAASNQMDRMETSRALGVGIEAETHLTNATGTF